MTVRVDQDEQVQQDDQFVHHVAIIIITVKQKQITKHFDQKICMYYGPNCSGFNSSLRLIRIIDQSN